MLNRSVAVELMENRFVEPVRYENVTIYFSDIVEFTKLTRESEPIEVIIMMMMIIVIIIIIKLLYSATNPSMQRHLLGQNTWLVCRVQNKSFESRFQNSNRLTRLYMNGKPFQIDGAATRKARLANSVLIHRADCTRESEPGIGLKFTQPTTDATHKYPEIKHSFS